METSNLENGVQEEKSIMLPLVWSPDVIDELMILCSTYIDPEYARRKLKKSGASVLKVNISDPKNFGICNCSKTMKREHFGRNGEIEYFRYHLAIKPNGAVLEITDLSAKNMTFTLLSELISEQHSISPTSFGLDSAAEVILAGIYDLNTLRIFHLKKRMSLVVNKKRDADCVLDKIATANVEIRRSIAEISPRNFASVS